MREKLLGLLLTTAAFWASGCSSSASNVVTVTVSQSNAIVVAGQAYSFTATVGGSSTTTVVWTCTFTLTTTTNGTPTTTKPAPCPTDGSYGTLSDPTKNTITYTAPSLAKFPKDVPILTLTATADADHKKTGTVTIYLDSGIRVSISPTAATVPVGLKPNAATQKFTAVLYNDPGTDVTYLVTQTCTGASCTNTTPKPTSPSCSPACGTIDATTGVFTAPSTLPTDATVYVVVSSNTDSTRYTVAIITLVNVATNGITFNGISPTSAPAGGIVQDIYLDAHNLPNTQAVYYAGPGTTPPGTQLDSTQVFITPISSAYCTSSSTVTCGDSSVIARVRLNESQLSQPGTANLSAYVTDPNDSSKTILRSYPLTLFPVRPGVVAASPGGIVQGNPTNLSVDGGFYGANASQVKLIFNGAAQIGTGSSNYSRQFTAPVAGIEAQNPGLYPVSVQSNVPIAIQPKYPTATTNIAVQPSFAGYTPAPASIPLAASGANVVPSSIAVNSSKHYAVIVEQAANSVQAVDLSSGVPVLSGAPLTSANFSAPTSISIDDRIQLAGHPGADLGVMVNSGNNSLSLLALTPGAAPVELPQKVDLTGLVPGTFTAPPAPYAVGVDPGTHLGVVAYSNTNIGFIVDVNPASARPCFFSSQTPPCAVASVSLNTGATPQVILQPEVPFAYVSPGGAGVLSLVDLKQQNTPVSIAAAPGGIVRTNNVVVVKTVTPHGINPGTGGTVLIAGATPDGSDSSIASVDGSFQVPPSSGVLDPYTFQFVQPGSNKDATGGGGTVQYGSPYLTYNITNTVTGMAIDPVSRTLGYADWNATVAQIGFIGTLDQSVTSLTLVSGGFLGTPGNGPEIGARWVAFDPYTNLFISFNPQNNQISLINPGVPSQRNTQGSAYRIIAPIPTGATGVGSYTPAGATSPVTVYGAMAYDPSTRLILVANSGSNNLTYLNIDTNAASPFAPVQLQNLRVTSAAGSISNAQPALGSGYTGICDPNSSVTTDNVSKTINSCFLQGIQTGATGATFSLFGKGFSQLSSFKVLFDGLASPKGSTDTIQAKYVSDSQIDVTSIPAGFLTTPHDFSVSILGSSSGGAVTTNTLELFVVGVTDLSSVCSGAKPEAVAFDPEASIAVVTNNGCSPGTVAILNMDTTGTLYGGAPYGSIIGKINVGHGPLGVALSTTLSGKPNTSQNPPLRTPIPLAIVANNTDATVSIIDISDPTNPKLAVSKDVAVGIAPQGVAVDQDHGYALIANSGSSTISYIDLTVLLPDRPSGVGTPTSVPIATDPQPRSIAVDPNRSIAVVTAVQFPTISTSIGALDVINLSGPTPVKSSSLTVSGLTSTPTGIVYDPAVSPGLFYATSTGANALYAFNPDNSATQQIRVGINPYSLGYNYQTSTLFSVNTGSNTSSVVDSQTFRTRGTFALSSQSMFATDVDRANNTVIMVDQNNNRVLFIALPK